MNRPIRKFFSILLVLCLLFTCAGTSVAFAAEPDLDQVVDTPQTEPAPSDSPEETEPPAETTAPDQVLEPVPQPEDTPVTEESAQPEAEAQTAAITDITELLNIARQDGAQAAALLSAYTDDAAYMDALSQILDIYYKEGLTAQLEAFSAAIDARAAEKLQNYAAAAAERAGGSLGYVPGEVLVVFDSGVSQTQAEATMQSLDGAVKDVVEAPSSEVVAVVDIPLDQTVAQAVTEITADPAVSYAQPNYLYDTAEAAIEADAGAASLPNDPDIDKQWHLNKINVGEAWNIVDSKNGSKVKVAILDNIVDLSHEDLASNIIASQCFDMQTGVAQPYPSAAQPHGTHVAGLIGAVANNGKGVTGVASGSRNQVVEMIAYNVFRNSDNKAPTSAIIAALNHAVLSGAKVVNMSLGYTQSQVLPADKLFEDAVNDATSKGTVVVAAAGNYSSDATFLPGDFDNAIGVISTLNYTDPTSNSKTSTSNYGDKKDISAPGNAIYSTYPGNTYANNSGTSMASPIVAGVAAMMLYVNPSLTPAQIKDMITGTATDLYTPGFDSQTAWGNVNAYRAVAKAANMVIPATPQNFKATAQGTTGAALSWSSVSGVNGYNIYRSESADGSYTLIRTNTAASQTSYTDTGLTLGKTYYYKVASYVTSGSTTLESIPAGPASVVAAFPAPGNFKAEKVVGQESVNLSWGSVSGSTGYEVYRSDSETGQYSLISKVQGVSTLQYTDNTVINGRTYFYKVNAYLTQGGIDISGNQTSAVKVVVSDGAGPVTNLKAESTGYNSAQISWDVVSGADGYNVYRSTSVSGTYSLAGSSTTGSFSQSGLSTGGTYYFKVRAYRTQGSQKVEGPDAGPVSAKPVNAAPESLKLSKATGGFKLTWTKSAGATGYDIYRSESKTGTYKVVGTVAGANTLTYTDTAGLGVGKTYYYKVAAYRNMSSGKVTGADSPIMQATKSTPKPENLAGKGQNTSSIKLTWNRPEGALGYYIYRSTNKSGGYKSIKLMTSSASALSYTDSKDLAPGTKYYYKVIPYILVDGNKVKGITGGPVAAQTKSATPAGIKAEFTGAAEVSVSWGAVDGAAGYQVYRATAAAGPFSGVKTLTTNSFKDTSVSSGTTYYYKVRSYRTVSGQKVFSTFSPVATAFRQAEKPVYTIGVPNVTNNNLTSSLFSMTNRGTKDIVIQANTAKLMVNPESSSGYDRTLTLWVDGIKQTSTITLKPGEQKRVSFTCSPATVYTPSSHVIFNFTCDGRTAQNDVSAAGGASWKYID